MLSSFIFYIISFAGLLSALLVIVSVNPVHKVLFLALCFFFFSVILLLLGVEFIPILFIIIYIGAIAVLFLFVVMMLDIKLAHKNNDFVKFLPIFILSIFIVYLFFIGFFTKDILSFNDFNLIHGNWLNCIDNNTNIEILGKILFIDYYLYVLLSGIVLLLSLIGSIVLTLKFDSKTNYQIISEQISRDLNLAVFFIK